MRIAQDALPGLVPVFTSIKCGRDAGSQRVTFLHRGPLRLTQLGALMNRLGLGHQLPGLMQITGLCLGGRFDLPERSVLIGLRESSEGPELKLEIMLGMIPDVPPAFLDLLTLGLSERPRELSALGRWLRAFTPEEVGWPGEFSVLSIRATQRTAARVNLYLRPAEYEVKRRLTDYRIGRPDADAPDGSTADGGSAGGGYEHGDYGDFGGYGGPMPAAEYRVTAGGRRDDHGCGCGTPVAAAQFGLGGGYGQALAALRDRGGAGPRRRF